MIKISSIDLWTQRAPQSKDCFGAFFDGIKNDISTPYDFVKIIYNCNCIISNNLGLKISNKHHAIIFYKNDFPVRLMVSCKNTDIKKSIKKILNQKVNNKLLSNIFSENNVKIIEIDLNEKPIVSNNNLENELDTSSCDRIELLKGMLSVIF